VNNNIDYSGKYTGNVTLTTTVLGRSGSQPQQLIIDVSKGDTSNQIKILFGGYLSKASLNGKHFTLQPISDNYFRITGYGDFLANNQMSITYIQTAINGSETIQYSGTITKF